MATSATSISVDAPLVSLVTPAHRAADTLERMFASVARQSMSDWEHIVLVNRDDHETRAIAIRAAEGDPRITIVEASCNTAASARNLALEKATGRYVLFLDADDTIRPRHLETLVHAARKTTAQSIVSGYRRIAPDGSVIAIRHPDHDISASLAHGPVTAIHAMLYERELIANIGGFDEKLRTNEDWDLCLRAAETGATFARSNAISADYWTGHASLSSNSEAMLQDRRTVRDKSIALEDEDRTDASLDALRTCLWTGAIALARGESPAELVFGVPALPPATADPVEGSAALLDGFLVGFACPETQVSGNLERKWPDLRTFLAAIAQAAMDPGLDRALLRRFEQDLARLNPGWSRTRIGSTLVVPAQSALLRRIHVPNFAEQVVYRLPLLRPRRLATFAVAPRVARTTGLPAIVLERFGRRLTAAIDALEGPAAALRDRSRRALALAMRIPRRLLGSNRSDAETATSAQELTGEDRWEKIFASEDPWNYTNAYETLKYDRTLSLLPEKPLGRALELACAEGIFTTRLAKRVERLTAADISETALQRASERCNACGIDNALFEQLDFFDSPIGSEWDLIVCSEVLYYMNDREQLAAFAKRATDALQDGGYFLHAHAYEIVDSPGRTGFDWGDNFAAATISKTFHAQPGLKLVRSIETELYCIELYRKSGDPLAEPQIERLSARASLDDDLASTVVWNGAILSQSDAETKRTFRVPVLMYHSVSETGPNCLSEYRVDPESFERQLVFLRRRGFRSLDLEEWEIARTRSGALSGRPVLITFDDGYKDFADTAWPILKRNGFGAHVFVVTGKVGEVSSWDRVLGEPAPLMDWQDIRALADEGVTFGSHLVSHTAVDRLSREDAWRELTESRATFEAELDTDVTTLALPFGVTDPAIEDLARRAGYTSVFGIEPGLAPAAGCRMQIPRIGIGNSMSLEDFALALGGAEPPDGRDSSQWL